MKELSIPHMLHERDPIVGQYYAHQLHIAEEMQSAAMLMDAASAMRKAEGRNGAMRVAII